MGIISIVFLIIGIFLIIGNPLIISRYKQKYPEEEFDYRSSSLVIMFFGSLLIVCAVTGLILFLVLLTFVISIMLHIYYVRYPDIKSQFSTILGISRDIMWFICFIFTMIFILAVISYQPT